MKTFDQFKKELSEDTPANSMGGGFSVSSAASNPNPNMAGYDPILFGGKKRKRDKFAGAEVFKVKSEDYVKSVIGRKKWQRWNKSMNMEEIDNQEIRTYCHRNPGKAVIIQDENSGVMSYLIPPTNSDAGKIATLGESKEKDKDKDKKPMFTKRTKPLTKEEEQAALDYYTRAGKPFGRRVASRGFNLGDKNPPIKTVYDA